MKKQDAIDIFRKIKEWFCEEDVSYDVVCKAILPYFKKNMGYDINDSSIIKENKVVIVNIGRRNCLYNIIVKRMLKRRFIH